MKTVSSVESELLHIEPSYDCIVVGAGISGLSMTLKLLKECPTWSIALAERYKGLGGRTYSYEPTHSIHWEMGASRIHASDTQLMKLIKSYGLTWIPISSNQFYRESGSHPLEKNNFESELIPLYIEPLASLDPSILKTHTLQSCMNMIYGTKKTKTIMNHFPYTSEFDTLRADYALKTFLDKGKLGTRKDYGILKEGFSALVACMHEEIKSLGGVILQRHRLLNIQKSTDAFLKTANDLTFEFGYNEGTIVLRANKAVVLALHKDAVAELPVFRGWKTLKYLKTRPLLRTYMIFDTKKQPAWFSGLNTVVTSMPLRYILPINPEKGVLQCSYTEGKDTELYMKLYNTGGEAALQKKILQDLQNLFPEVSIPTPTFFKVHFWETGTTYWLPGTYDPEKVSMASLKPLPSVLPSVWLCGESWSLQQAWVEGALEQTELCFTEMKKAHCIERE